MVRCYPPKCLVCVCGSSVHGARVCVFAAGVEQLWHPAEQMTVTWEVWGVLGLSFAIDGVVFTKVRQRETGRQLTRNVVRARSISC